MVKVNITTFELEKNNYACYQGGTRLRGPTGNKGPGQGPLKSQIILRIKEFICHIKILM